MSSERTTGSKETPVCASRSCDNPAAGVGPFSGLSLCQSHLDRDVQMVETRKTELLNKLQMVMDPEHRAALRAEQSSLAAEVQQVIDRFDEVQEKLQQWKDRAASRVQAVHDSVARRLRDSAEAEECSKEVSVACDAGDMRKVMELTMSVDSWLDEASNRLTDFKSIRSDLGNRQIRTINGQLQDSNERESDSDKEHQPPDSEADSNERESDSDKEHQAPDSEADSNEQMECPKLRSVGDVAAGVQQLQFMIDRHMADVMQQCWLDEGEASTDPLLVCRFVASINDLPDDPMNFASCTNTAGFVGDASDRVIRGESGAEDCVTLPQPCLFVSFRPSSAVENLLVTSLDGAVRLQYQCNLDWEKWIVGIHCDSNRQQLFIAQKNAVTVTDLSGHVIREIKSSSLGQPAFDISGIDGNADKVFVPGNRVRKIAAIGKDSGDIEFELDLTYLHAVNLYDISLYGNKLLLVDNAGGQLLSVCAISGQLIGCYPTLRSGLDKFEGPWDGAVDSRGLIFFSEEKSHSVRIMTTDGSIVQTLGTAGQSGSDGQTFTLPVGLAIVEDGELRCLVVADCCKRLRLFELLGTFTM